MIEPAVKVMADGYSLPIDRADWLDVGDLWGRGWSIIPLQFKSKLPALRSWTEYQKRPARFEELQTWFEGPEPLNIGIVCGRVSGIFVVDCDSPAALGWAREHLPPCEMRVRTAKGLHLYYPYSGDRPIRNKVRTKYQGVQLELDIRADRGYVVGPGSVHPSGFVYSREGTGWL